MILLLGASGYFGQAFAIELRRRGRPFIPLTRSAFDYTRFDLLFDYVRRTKPEFLINAAAFTGRPNVDACEEARPEVFQVNTLLPQSIARVCLMTNTPWGHVSSGCIYSGAKIFENGKFRIERNLNTPQFQRRLQTHPETVRGFDELDEPNFSFQNDLSNVCSGTRVLAERAIRDNPATYIWRPRIPFNERDEPCNLLSKMLSYPRIYDNTHSLSHLEESVSACLDLWELDAPYGIYNVTNPGAINTREIVEMIQRILKPRRTFRYWNDDTEFYRLGARVPRSNCILDVTKLLVAGARMRPIEEAIEHSLKHWKAATPALELLETAPRNVIALQHSESECGIVSAG
jgi:dTDP-4-dehydrorhamnose reductase